MPSPDKKWPGALSFKSKFEKVVKCLKTTFYQFIQVETDTANNFVFKSLCLEGSPVEASYSNYSLYSTEAFIGHCVDNSLKTTTSVFQYLTGIWGPLHWRHNGHDSVSNHQHHDCLLNRLFRRRSKKTSKFRVTDLCAGNSPETGDFPAEMASNAGECFHLMTSSW